MPQLSLLICNFVAPTSLDFRESRIAVPYSDFAGRFGVLWGGRKNVGMDGGYGSGAIKVTEGVVIEFKGVIRVGFFTVICR